MCSSILKKHIGAIQISGRLTLLQRKVFNVLLLNAYPELPENDEFSISTTTLASMAGFDSHNTAKLKTSFRALARTSVEWNILEGEDNEQWTTSSLLADATVMKHQGVCTYSYSRRLKEKLYHPDIYARINLAIQRQFSSAHGLVLYENCARFRNVHTTGWLSLDSWRKLFGIGSHQYPEFKAFSRRVIKTAVDEVNQHSDLFIEPHYRKQQGRVVAIKFTIDSQSKPKSTATSTVLNQPNSLMDQLKAFELSTDTARGLMARFDAGHIQSNMDYVNALIKSGTQIRSKAAYLKKAIEDNYVATSPGAITPKRIEPAQDQARLIQQQQKALAESLHKTRCYTCIEMQLKSMDPQAIAKAEKTFDALLSNSNEHVMFRKRRWYSPMLYTQVLAFWQTNFGLTFPLIEDVFAEQGISNNL